MQIDHPIHFDAQGRTATTDETDHVRDMIELLLFTRPGERVNRPDFGSGLMHSVFAPNSPELATALEFTTRAALQRYLGDLIEVRTLSVKADDAVLRVDLRYLLRRSGDIVAQSFQMPSVSGATP
ncbi:MAG TPA: GPW/gp25 family protein [Burkholderiaceae bacterium]|nr:GPW/gp25 family protein [Burkholderiaceae bacterium]